MVKITDESNVDKLLNELKKLENRQIKIGILGSAESDILLIANVNEFGISINVTPKMRRYLSANGLHLKKGTTKINIPERSFIRSGADAIRKRVERFVNERIELVYSFQLTADQFLEQVGEYATGLIRNYMTNKRRPPNHPFTVQQKGSKNPLIDTGRLRSAITFEVI